MLGAGDAERVLGFLRERRSAYYESNAKEKREHLAIEIYGFLSSSPSANLDLRGDDNDLTDAKFAERFELATAMQPVENDKKASESATATLKVCNFEEMKKRDNEYIFQREPFTRSQPDALIEEATADNDSKRLSLLRTIFPPTQPPKMVSLHVFVRRPDKTLVELRVSVPENAYASKVMEDTKKTYEETTKENLPPATNWQLRISEDDGSLDLEFPPLRGDQSIHKLGRYFALVSGSSDSTRKTTSRSTAKLVKVILPNAQYQTLPFDPAMKVSVLLRKVCDKWSFSTTEYAFTTEEAPDEIPGDNTLRDLDVQTGGRNNIVLKKRQVKVDDQSKVFEKQYSVVKLKKFGLRQERVITIAPDLITNHSTKSGSTKKPVRLIRDVKYALLIDKKPNMFHLQFEGEEKIYTYKAKSDAEAKEIVARINFYKNKLTTTAG